MRFGHASESRAGILTTKIWGYFPPFKMTIQIEGGETNSPSAKRNRRTLALMIFRAMREVFVTFDSAVVFHSGETHFESQDEVSFRQTPDIQTPKGRAGFMIRTLRLKRGFTQEMTARLAGMTPVHLSRIEHGQCTPHRRTLLSLGRVLGKSLVTLLPVNEEPLLRKEPVWSKYGPLDDADDADDAEDAEDDS
jgi:transcriptional regulator with XRE-family HTH domain